METFSAADAVELATVDRSGFIESRHVGSLVVLGADGEVALSLGNPSAPVYPRSALKPFQATAVIASGVNYSDEYAAILAASHTGTPQHVGLVRTVLQSAGLTADALRCPADWPSDPKAQDELITLGEGRSPIYMNCSGKHAGMLAACVANGWPLESYLDPAHPIQLKTIEVIERFTGEKVAWSGVDGCGAPVHAVSLTGLARGIRALNTAKVDSPFGLYRAAAAVTSAMRRFGWVIDGPGEPDTAVIDRLGILVKLGAEGIMVMSTADGTTVAVKILDGNLRAANIVALHALSRAGALPLADVNLVINDLKLDIFGGGQAVGSIQPAF
jgi:L-asparaginase II